VTLRLALVGCGEHSRGSHAAPLARYGAHHPGAITLAAACDLDLTRAEEFCREFGFARAYADLGEMLAREWRDEADFISTTAIHALNALRFLAGEIKDYSVGVQRGRGLSSVWYHVSLSFESGAVGCLEVLPTAGMIEESYELFCEDFRARVVAGSGPQRTLHCWRDGRLEVEESVAEDEPEDLRNGAYEEVVEFAGALQAGRRPAPTVEEILPSSRVCFRIAEEVAQLPPDG
jgi:predicted dehydrogenase